MNKKEYKKPQVAIVKIGLSDNIMEGALTISDTTTETQFSRYRNKLWDDDEEDGDW